MASILNNTARLYNLSAYVNGKRESYKIIPGLNIDVSPEFVKAFMKSDYGKALADRGYIVVNDKETGDPEPKKEKAKEKPKKGKSKKKKTEKVEV